MKKILIVTGNYLPGYKDGGPIRSIQNLTEALGDEYQFYILAADRDLGESRPYKQLVEGTFQYDQWNPVGKAFVRYVRDGRFTKSEIEMLAEEMDLIYSTSFYREYGRYILWLKKCGKLDGKTVVFASMGVFSKGALKTKALKKAVYIGLMKVLGVFDGIIWSVTSPREEQELKEVIGDKATCMIAEDLPRLPVELPDHSYDDETLKIVFISRIVEKKNLTYACKVLREVGKSCAGKIVFHIYGPKEDKSYWEKCEKIIEEFGETIDCQYMGEVPAEAVPGIFAKYDVFLFPTRGENYGHVIYEALMAGCIPLISDQTPWLDFEEKQVGYVKKLEDINQDNPFVRTLQNLLKMSAAEKKRMSENAKQYAEQSCRQTYQDTGYRKIFDL